MKKVIVITGGSDGLGRVIAAKLSQDNQVIILARNEDKLKKTVKEITCDFRICDISDIESCKQAVEGIVNKYGRVDVLINNAGIWIEGDLVSNEPEKISDVLDINTKGAMFLSRLTVSHMLKQREGVIINIVSLAGLNPKALRTVYNASKWAMTGFTKSLALELAPKGIKVTGIYPGFMNTNLFSEYPNNRDASKGLELEEVAETVEFILNRKPKTHILSVELKNIDY